MIAARYKDQLHRLVDAGRGDTGPVADPRADVCADPGAAAPPFALVQRIFNENCTTCHSGAGPMVSLSAGMSWASLVQQPAPAPESCGGMLVVPGHPESSYLYEKLSSPTPCWSMVANGSLFRMPRSMYAGRNLLISSREKP